MNWPSILTSLLDYLYGGYKAIGWYHIRELSYDPTENDRTPIDPPQRELIIHVKIEISRTSQRQNWTDV